MLSTSYACTSNFTMNMASMPTKFIIITTNSDKAKTNFCQSFQNKQVFERLDNNNDDPNHNYQILEESLINSYNECFPTRVVKFNRKKT